MGTDDSHWDAGLSLGLGYEAWASGPPAAESYRKRDAGLKPEEREMIAGKAAVEPSLTLSLSDGTYQSLTPSHERRSSRQSPPHSVVSSFSNPFPSSSIKKEKDVVSEEDEAERVSSRISDEEDGSARKKLRLSKEQSTLLEERFKEHSTLNPKQKQALANQLNLRPRQVEVWFQNRRARTKLKQTEVDCEFLKRCCESLTDENRRLQKELQELRGLKFAPPLYMQLPATTLTLCPSCERITAATSDSTKVPSSAAGHFVMAPKAHLYNTFTAAHPPSAAC